jgi:hypothetical protein
MARSRLRISSDDFSEEELKRAVAIILEKYIQMSEEEKIRVQLMILKLNLRYPHDS